MLPRLTRLCAHVLGTGPQLYLTGHAHTLILGNRRSTELLVDDYVASFEDQREYINGIGKSVDTFLWSSSAGLDVKFISFARIAHIFSD